MTKGAGTQARIPAIDIARTLAILGMVAFHFTRDLEIFGLIAPGTTLQGGWAAFARLVAGSFLFLVGVSLVLAHGRGIRWPVFWRRFAIVAGAALAITLVTAVFAPGQFIYFGILHAIALSSVIALPFLRWPPIWAALAGVGLLVLHLAVDPAPFSTPWLGWTGLSDRVRPALDFLPLLPWLAPCLLGVAAGRWAVPLLPHRHAPATPITRALAWPGRHSLAIYLLHQPVLVGLLWVFVQLAGR
ncbi:heparan-alpha-glucosaminide N-acetyltransferase [Oceaniglobus trochenteri]|uniref:heparan-alpha-glucosaminide N-acetyltransferase n=1 Tax=Oceaniglobus trochenteri TaxID=2763260 RepID=UPI001CFFB855